MSDEVTGALGRVPGLRVASRNSALSIDMTKPVNVREVAERLHVGSVLEGQMRRSGNRFRVTMQLTNAADGLSLWSDTFDGDMTDVFAVQERIARAIADALRVQLASGFQVRGGTSNVEAHDLVLRARFLSDEYTAASLRQAIALFERATKLDDRYVDAWAGLAQAWFYMGDDYMPAKDAVIPGRVALERALALDSLNPEALVSLGTDQYYYRRQRAAGVATLRRALALDSLNETAMLFLATILNDQRDNTAASALILRFDRLNPSSRLRFRYMVPMNSALIASGHLAEAEKVCDAAREVDLQRYGGCKRRLLAAQGKLPEALASCRAFAPPPTLCGVELLLMLGRKKEASAEAELIEARAFEQQRAIGYTNPYDMAELWAKFGDRDRTMRFLLAAERDGSGSLLYNVQSNFDFLRGYPPFDALSKRLAWR
jgi:tetratricopeptide (TPR) repeat protein